MKPSRKLLFDISAGLILSSVFCILLSRQIISGGVATGVSLEQLLSDPESTIFCLLMSCFIFASWLIKGTNNRIVLYCWALGMVIHQIIFWWIYELFYNRTLNIYVLNFAGFISSIPVITFFQSRVTYTCWLAEKCLKLKGLEPAIRNYLSKAKSTDFEFILKSALFVGFSIEFLYGAYQSLYCLLFQIPFDGSLYGHMVKHQHWDPFNSYNLLMNLVTLSYIFIIGFHLFRDNMEQDAFLYGATRRDKRKIAEKILREVREKKGNKRSQK